VCVCVCVLFVFDDTVLIFRFYHSIIQSKIVGIDIKNLKRENSDFSNYCLSLTIASIFVVFANNAVIA